MAFRKDQTTAAQTAANVAGSVTVARIQSGEFSGGEDVNGALTATFDAIFSKLAPVVDADNALFAKVEAETAPTPITKTSKPKAETVVNTENPGETVFAGGKFKGLTIKAVYEMDEVTARDTYKHPYGAGSTYITNYVATDKNSNEGTRTAAQAYLAAIGKAA